MIHKIIISGRFDTMNEFIKANRTGNGRWNKGNQMKQRDQSLIAYQLRKQLKKSRITPKVFIFYHFFEKDKRRDMDNVSGYFHKIFQDALVQAGYLENDNWNYIIGFSDDFSVDSKNPRIEVKIRDGGE